MNITTSRRATESGLIAITHGLGDAVTTLFAVSTYGLPEINPVIDLLLEYSHGITFLCVTVSGVIIGAIWYTIRPSFSQKYSLRLARIVGVGFVASGFLLVLSNTLAIVSVAHG